MVLGREDGTTTHSHEGTTAMTKTNTRNVKTIAPAAPQANFTRHFDEFDLQAEREATSIRRAGELRPTRRLSSVS